MSYLLNAGYNISSPIEIDFAFESTDHRYITAGILWQSSHRIVTAPDNSG